MDIKAQTLGETMSTVPVIDAQAIWAVIELLELLEKQPELLKSSLPYPDPFVDLLKKLVKIHNKPTEKEPGKELTLEQEIALLRAEIDEYKDIAKSSEDETVFSSYVKLRVSVLNKVLEFQERIFNLSQMKEFEQKVLKAVDVVLTPEQKTNFIQLLEEK